jgi:hypothetical protein
MKGRTNLQELHEHVTNLIADERRAEAQEFQTARQEAEKRAQGREQRERKALETLGLDLSKLDQLERERHADAEKRFRETERRMNAESERTSTAALSLEGDVLGMNALPQDARALMPSWTGGFAIQVEQDQLTAAAVLPAQAILTGGACADYWNWASGGGWGCFGSGVGENQQWVEFGFWFLPNASKFYSIIPHYQYRGYYILQADDGVFTCKHTRTRVSAWTNVWQYNWKGWNSVDVLNRSGDNINENKRLDVDRYPYTSYLLGGGDWAFIRCVIGLYVRSQGSGSYAKNDFATGNANYLCVPKCYVS